MLIEYNAPLWQGIVNLESRYYKSLVTVIVIIKYFLMYIHVFFCYGYHYYFRVHDCINAGSSKAIDVSMDNGKWFALKKNKKLESPQVSGVPLLPFCGWRTFPGYPDDVPIHFNRGPIHQHIVESVQFINEEGAHWPSG